MFDLWKVPHESIDVKTSYGSTHVNASGPGDGYSPVLLHGAGLTSTVWFANISELSAHHRVYAVDVVADASKSVADRLAVKRANYAHWLKEVAEIIPNAGHLLIMDQSEIINALILRFLNSD